MSGEYVFALTTNQKLRQNKLLRSFGALCQVGISTHLKLGSDEFFKLLFDFSQLFVQIAQHLMNAGMALIIPHISYFLFYSIFSKVIVVIVQYLLLWTFFSKNCAHNLILLNVTYLSMFRLSLDVVFSSRYNFVSEGQNFIFQLST